MDTKNIIAANKRRTKHGMYLSSVYAVWRSMKARCNNKHPRYGGRGIKVCKRWELFENFYADMGDPPRGATLDRINVNGNYTPANCRWATVVEQQNNMRTNRKITYKGKTQTVAQWARETGIAYHVLKYRVSNGWKPPKLFTTDNLKGKTSKHMVIYNGKQMSLRDAAKASGIKYQTLYARMRLKQPLF